MPRNAARKSDAHVDSPNPRRHALEIVSEALSPGGRAFAQELLDERLARAPMKPEDRRLASDLTYGVIRRLGTLDAVLAAYSARPLEKLDAGVRQVLRLGLYQVLFLERVPAHAAVDESVRLARAIGKHAATGFVNAVLRSVARDTVFSPAPDPERPRHSFHLTATRAATFGRPVLPPPEDAAAYLAARHSLPLLLAERWLRHFDPEQTREIAEVINDLPPLFIRPNRQKTTPEALLERLRAAGIEATPSLSGRTLRLPPHALVAKLPGFDEGLFQVQDDSSALVAEYLGVQPGEKVLDMAAAPGGKACHMAERMERQGQIVAVDNSARRLERVIENMQRLDLPIIATVEAEGAAFALEHPESFDRVLLDAPCSNTGVLRRRVEARWRFSEEGLAEIVAIQRPMLEAGLRALKPGGTMVYCTCSLEPEENSQLVRAALASAPGFRLDAEQQLLPQHDGGDGLYMARIVREP